MCYDGHGLMWGREGFDRMKREGLYDRPTGSNRKYFGRDLSGTPAKSETARLAEALIKVLTHDGRTVGPGVEARIGAASGDELRTWLQGALRGDVLAGLFGRQ